MHPLQPLTTNFSALRGSFIGRLEKVIFFRNFLVLNFLFSRIHVKIYFGSLVKSYDIIIAPSLTHHLECRFFEIIAYYRTVHLIDDVQR